MGPSKTAFQVTAILYAMFGTVKFRDLNESQAAGPRLAA
jgi:hypothetical protein